MRCEHIMTLNTFKLIFKQIYFCIVVTALGLTTQAAAAKEFTLSNLNWLDKQHLNRQIKSIDDITREHFGSQIKGHKDDLELLQRIIYLGLINKNDHLTLQALGAVFGQVLNQELNLPWQRYSDAIGISRAICAIEFQECVFPITIFSRRMSVGLLPNVHDLYKDSVQVMTPFLPSSPYRKLKNQ